MNAKREARGVVVATIVAAAAPGAMGVFASSIASGKAYPLDAVMWFGITLVVGLPVATVHMMLLGLPVYERFARRDLVHWWTAAIGGALIGALPLSLLMLGLAAFHVQSAAELMSLALTSLRLPFVFALSGMLGGVTLWAFVRERGKQGAAA